MADTPSKRTPNVHRTRSGGILTLDIKQQLLLDLQSDTGQKGDLLAVLSLRPNLYGDPQSKDAHQRKLHKACYDKLRKLVTIKAEEPEEYW